MKTFKKGGLVVFGGWRHRGWGLNFNVSGSKLSWVRFGISLFKIEIQMLWESENVRSRRNQA